MSELALDLIAENEKTCATFLDLSDCDLTEVPDDIGDLVWLEELSFATEWGNKSENWGNYNNIAQLGSDWHWHQLKKLKKLWLSDNKKLADLSPLSNLTLLQLLDISGTKVTKLSPLSGLMQLRSLNVSYTPITKLGPLSGLMQLRSLNVSYTPITDLSPLSNLTHLQSLDVSGTKVTKLSPLSGLTQLQSLDVSGTKVTKLSPLSGLTQLRSLNVSYTPITDLNPLSDLTLLQLLDISSSHVSDLSPLLILIEKGLEVKWSSRWWEGSGIYVKDCQLTNPPVAIVKQGNAAIVNYFKEKQSQGTDYLYEAKLLLVGAGGAGKTSLVRRLYQCDKPLPDENETTKGIEIHQHEFIVQDSRYPNGRNFRLNVWDFAGQEKYRPTDTLFFTQRSLYVLLDDTRNNDKTVHDENFKHWLDAVDLLSQHSPVLIFQNEKGGRSKDIDFKGIQNKFNIKALYQGNLEHANAADSLRDAIEFYAKQLPHIGEELPERWLNIRADIEQQAQQHPTISLKDYFALYEKHLPFDRDKALHLSHYFHDLGVFLHYQDNELLNRTIILQNQWATEAVFKMLDDEVVKRKYGHFTAEDCQRLWQNSDYAELHPELRALMEKFELCYLLPDSNPKTWLAPQLLSPSKPAELSDWTETGDLVLRYRYEFLPKGMISRLMVRQHRFVPRPDLGWLTGVLFERNRTQVLIELSPQGNEIVLRARGIERKELLSVIATDLETLNATFKGLPDKVTVLIPCCCKQCQTKQQPESFEKKLLLKRKQDRKLTIECPASYEDVKVSDLLDGIHAKTLPDWSKEEIMKKIFISYSKKDKRYKDALLNHLEGLRGKIITWNDADLLAGEDWDESIKDELNKADIVLYLVSANSMATDYIHKVELPLVEERCNKGDCKLVPIIVSSCHWTQLDFAKKNALPNKGVPIRDKSWGNQDVAWTAVIQQLEKIV